MTGERHQFKSCIESIFNHKTQNFKLVEDKYSIMLFKDLYCELRGTKVLICGFYAVNWNSLHMYFFCLCFASTKIQKKNQTPNSTLRVGYFKVCATAQITSVHARTIRNMLVEMMECLCSGWVWKNIQRHHCEKYVAFMSSFHSSYLKIGKLHTANYIKILLQLQV